MGIIQKWKLRREIKKLLDSNDKAKLESVIDYNKDENLENIILSIKDKNTRAQALQETIHKIDSKEVLKSIIPTLKDDDILVILEKKPEYLKNDTRNILYTTISGIIDPKKRIRAIKKFYKNLSDKEISDLLSELKDEKIRQKDLQDSEDSIESLKIEIITNKIINNYITTGTLLHMTELLGCLELEVSKVEVVENALIQEEKLQDKVKKGELPDEYQNKDRLGNNIRVKNCIFDDHGKRLLIKKSFENIHGSKTVEKRKKEIIIKLYEKGLYSYEEARDVLNAGLSNEAIIKDGKKSLLKIEGRRKIVEEVRNKGLIEAPVAIEETGEIIKVIEDVQR